MLKKLKIELPYELATPLLNIHSEKTKVLIQKDTCTPVFKAAQFTIAKTKNLDDNLSVHQQMNG